MKNVNEWSLEFDQMYQNITSNQAPGLTEYEKSVRLTRAEWDVQVMLYKGQLGQSFEETEEMTHYLNSVVKQYEATSPEASASHIVSSSKVFKLPGDMLFRTLEVCKIDRGGCGSVDAIVVPVTQDEYWRTSRDPFKKQNANRVLRLSYGTAQESSSGLEVSQYSELVSDYPIQSYTVRYVKKPEPIILVDLEDGYTIDGETKAKTCKLPEALHQLILTEAVKAAKAIWNA